MVISHQERILEIADEIVVIRDGSISAKGSKEEMVLLGESLGLEPKVIEGSLGFFWKDPSGKFLLGTEDGK